MQQILGFGIGLTLVFAVFAVIVSSATEAVAGLIGQRSRKLEQGLQRMLGSGAKGSYDLVDELYSDPLIIAMTSATWGKRKPSYLDRATFTTALLNVTDLTSTIADRMKQIADSLKPDGTSASQVLTAAGVELPDQAKAALTELWNKAKHDETVFVKSVEDWFDGQMNRVSGWYGRWAQLVMFAIAILLAIVLNMSATTVARALWANQTLQDNAAAIGEKVAANNSTTTTPEATTTTVAVPGTTTSATSTPTPHVPTYADLEDVGLPIGWTATVWPGLTFALVLHILGWFLMALAGSFGAPVWFDLLNKFVNLRVAGQKPEATST